jgi:hypothetical protein
VARREEKRREEKRREEKRREEKRGEEKWDMGKALRLLRRRNKFAAL